jgi:hypothetical protein
MKKRRRSLARRRPRVLYVEHIAMDGQKVLRAICVVIACEVFAF